MLTIDQYLLNLVQEECAEIAQRASKAIRFGLKQTQSGQIENNAQRLVREVVDLSAVLKLLEERGAIENPYDMDAMLFQKEARIKSYIQRARLEGVLEAEGGAQ